jgi:hypothetical protein
MMTPSTGKTPANELDKKYLSAILLKIAAGEELGIQTNVAGIRLSFSYFKTFSIRSLHDVRHTRMPDSPFTNLSTGKLQ